VHSYVDYARLGVLHGLNPYVHPPSAAPGDPAFAEVDWTGATSVYGPLFTLATYPLAHVSIGTAVLALKLAAALSVVGLAWLAARLAPARGVDPLRAAAFVGLNPLVLVHVVGGPHNDGLAMLIAMLGAGAVLAGEEAAGGAGYALAAGVKASALFSAPFALLGAQRRGRLLAGAVAGALLLALVSWPAFGLHWLSAVDVAGRNLDRTSHMSLPGELHRLTGLDAEWARRGALYIYGAIYAWLLLWTWRGGDWLRAAAWAGALLLLATTWLLPWYLIWALPLAALSRDRPLQLLVLAITAFQLGTRLPI
jgi:alpha-1,6-mannosyltransferase